MMKITALLIIGSLSLAQGEQQCVECPTMECGTDMMSCPPPPTADLPWVPMACPPSPTCVPATVMGADGTSCAGLCPTHCGNDQFMCPTTGPVAMNCPAAPTCLPYLKDKNGNNCPMNCPVMCGPGMMQCPGGTNSMGCPRPDTCMPDGSAAATSCPGICPVTCGLNEVLCYPPTYPATAGPAACPPAPFCQKAYPPTSKGVNCPAFCPMMCPSGHVVCPSNYDGNGCKMPPTCAPTHTECPMPTNGPDGCPMPVIHT